MAGRCRARHAGSRGFLDSASTRRPALSGFLPCLGSASRAGDQSTQPGDRFGDAHRIQLAAHGTDVYDDGRSCGRGGRASERIEPERADDRLCDSAPAPSEKRPGSHIGLKLTSTLPTPVIVSFYCGDRYYYRAAETLREDCARLGLDHDIVEIEKARSDSWLDVCRRKPA